jgi:NAD(P)-dependent dehydrogenase (short-subunit alcohol dehydrogenase family)
MNISLEDQVALVTGGARGIGLAAVRALAEAGARVAATSRSGSDALRELASVYPVVHIPVNAATESGARQAVAETVATFGRLDILVNNIGATDPSAGAGFTELTDREWSGMLEVNLMSVIRVTRAALPHLCRNESGGSVVNVSTMNAIMPIPFLPAYSAAKAAVTNLTKNLALTYAPQGVRFNTVAPGPTRTDMWAGRLPEPADEGALRAFAREQLGIPLGRLAEPEDVANLIVFLASDRAAMITGSDYIIDGGLVKTIH